MRTGLHILIACLAWFAIATQYALMVQERTASIVEMTLRYFSFFTILTNLLVALYFTFQVFDKRKNAPSLFNKPESLTAIAVYITVVGLVYQVALRHLWQPTGLRMVAYELLHSLIPLLVVVYWAGYAQKSQLAWKAIPQFLVYPFVYLVFILIRGKLANYYPYPFIDVVELGWPQTLRNIAVLIFVFVCFSVLFIAIGKRMHTQHRQAPAS